MFDIRSMMKNSREIVGDEASQLRAVKRDWYAIHWIHSPSENVQLEAVKQNGYVIRYIHSPSENVQLEAVKQNGYAIQYIHSPSENVQLEAVKQNGCAIRFIHSPSENVMQAALAQDPNCIEHFKRAWLANLKNAKKLTVSEIEELLGYKVEVVAERV